LLAIGSAGLASNARCRTHRSRLERSLHDLFARASLDIEIKDRFGKPIRPREWFLLPLSIIGQAVPMIVMAAFWARIRRRARICVVVISVGWESTVTWVWPAVVNAGSERGVVVKDYRITRNEPWRGPKRVRPVRLNRRRGSRPAPELQCASSRR